MNLRELADRFDAFARAVEMQLRAAGVDPSVVLTIHRARFAVEATTVPGAKPFLYSARLDLQHTAVSVEDLADRFVRNWREQRRIDDAV